MKNISIKQKITALVLVVGFLIFICSTILAINEIRNGLTQGAENKINEITELA